MSDDISIGISETLDGDRFRCKPFISQRRVSASAVHDREIKSVISCICSTRLSASEELEICLAASPMRSSAVLN